MEASIFDWHNGPVFRTWNVGEGDGVPHDEIAVFNVPVSVRDVSQTILSAMHYGIGSGSTEFVFTKWGGPDVVAGKGGSFSYLGALLGK